MEPRQEVVERLLTAAVLLQRKNAELEAKLATALDQMTVLTALVDSDHAAIMVLMGQRQAVLLCEERICLVCYRPNAFVTGSLTTSPPS